MIAPTATDETLALPSHEVAAPPRVRWYWLRRLVAFAVFGVILLALFLVRPYTLGGPMTYVIVSGQSMEPTLDHGDLVVIERQSSYRRGDVVAYRVPKGDPGEGRFVIHRIIGGDAASGYVLRGDNRKRPDHWRPRPGDVQGKLRLHLPGTGHALAQLRAPLGMAFVCALIAFLVIALPDRRES